MSVCDYLRCWAHDLGNSKWPFCTRPVWEVWLSVSMGAFINMKSSCLPWVAVLLTQLIIAIWGAPVSTLANLQRPYWGLEMWNFAAISATPPAVRKADRHIEHDGKICKLCEYNKVNATGISQFLLPPESASLSLLVNPSYANIALRTHASRSDAKRCGWQRHDRCV